MKVRLIKGSEAFGYPVSALRTEARKGRLDLIRVAGKDYVTLEAVERMEKSCRKSAKVPACISGTSKDMNQSTSSSTVPNNTALAAALINCEKLRKGLLHTSTKITGQTPSNVVSLKSSART